MSTVRRLNLYAHPMITHLPEFGRLKGVNMKLHMSEPILSSGNTLQLHTSAKNSFVWHCAQRKDIKIIQRLIACLAKLQKSAYFNIKKYCFQKADRVWPINSKNTFKQQLVFGQAFQRASECIFLKSAFQKSTF